jgi:hypothetical protein
MINLNKINQTVVVGFLCLFGVVASNNVLAKQFNVGDTVFAAFPVGNIKNDAFIIGNVTRVLENGDYQLAVMDYVEGHDYGSSCVPMVKYENQQAGVQKDNIWSLWEDTTKLNTEQLEYVVPKDKVLELGYGKTYFIERNNLYIIFGRWLSGAPMMNIERMESAIKDAKKSGLSGMEPAFRLAQKERQAFYGDKGIPLENYQTIAPLIEVMQHVDKLFSEDALLKKHWYARPRNWSFLNNDTRRYFMVQAVDKVLESVWEQVYEDNLEKAEPKDIATLKNYLKIYKR